MPSRTWGRRSGSPSRATARSPPLSRPGPVLPELTTDHQGDQGLRPEPCATSGNEEVGGAEARAATAGNSSCRHRCSWCVCRNQPCAVPCACTLVPPGVKKVGRWGPCWPWFLMRWPGLASSLKVTQQAQRKDPGLGRWTRSPHRRQQVGGAPRTQEPPSPMGKQPLPRSDFLMLSTERDGERQTQTETWSETETERQAGREAERKAPLSQCETPQECTQRPRGWGPGGGTLFPAACPPGLTQLSDCPASRLPRLTPAPSKAETDSEKDSCPVGPKFSS